MRKPDKPGSSSANGQQMSESSFSNTFIFGKKMTKYLSGMIALAISLAVTGCGDGSPKSNVKMELPKLGLSMTAPAGWRADRDNPQMSYNGDSTCMMLDEPLEGKDFWEYVQQLSKANMGKAISSVPMSIGGFDAVQTVIDYPHAGSKAIKVFIHKGDSLVEISFVTPAEDFAGHEPSLRESIASITIK